jgi:hypothetical protein
MSTRLRVVIGIATAARREQIGLTVRQIARQRHLPERILVCPARVEDYDDSASASVSCPVSLIAGGRGLCVQRNAILDHAGDADVIVFFDDDFYPADDYLERVVALFTTHPEVVIATNRPALDGATGPGVDHEEALRALAAMPRTTRSAPPTRSTYGGYGCNMAIRLAPVRAYHVRFDEDLPLYGWLEDIDFSRRLAPYGRIVSCTALRGVHLGTKRGRTSGVQLGYSQIANPVYMLRKRSMDVPYAFRHMGRNVAKNVLRAPLPEPWVDRRGRLKGNALALLDLLSGRLHPRRVLEL